MSKLLLLLSLQKSDKSKSLFNKEWCEWFAHFWEWIALLLKKTTNLLKKNCCFHHVFDNFSLFSHFYAQEQIAPIALSLAFGKEWMANLLFRLQKKSNLYEKPKSKFPTLGNGEISTVKDNFLEVGGFISVVALQLNKLETQVWFPTPIQNGQDWWLSYVTLLLGDEDIWMVLVT